MAKHRGDPALSAWPESIEQMQLKTIELEAAIDTARFWGRLAGIEDLQLKLSRETARLDQAKLQLMAGEGLLDRHEHRPGQHRAVRRPGRYGPRTAGSASS